MVFRIVTAAASIFVLVGIAARNIPECRKVIDERAAIDIAITKMPKFTGGANKAVFESDAFASKHLQKDKTENGWSVSPYRNDNFDGYVARFDFNDGRYEGWAQYNVTKCGEIKLSLTGAWPMKPISE